MWDNHINNETAPCQGKLIDLICIIDYKCLVVFTAYAVYNMETCIIIQLSWLYHVLRRSGHGGLRSTCEEAETVAGKPCDLLLKGCF